MLLFNGEVFIACNLPYMIRSALHRLGWKYNILLQILGLFLDVLFIPNISPPFCVLVNSFTDRDILSTIL